MGLLGSWMSPHAWGALRLVVLNAETDIDRIAAQVDSSVFSAVDMKKEEIQALEEAYARGALWSSIPRPPLDARRAHGAGDQSRAPPGHEAQRRLEERGLSPSSPTVPCS